MNFYAIRGAITIEADEKEEIISKTEKLLNEVIGRNNIKHNEIISIIFTCTDDITAAYPAVAARELGITSAALMCCQEMKVENSLKSCIRLMMHIQRPDEFIPKHIYLGKASALRPDLAYRDKTAIAIDGPAGAGKSTIAKLLAKKLGFLYLDTGAMYRAMALKMLRLGCDPGNPSEVLPHLKDTDIRIEYSNGSQIVILDGEDVTGSIRTPQVSRASSDIAVIPEVREKLVEIQRSIASSNSVVMDGRDIGTYVLPNAEKKFFLTASVEERALRRYQELKESGKEQDYEALLEEIKARDKNDSSRKVAPLKKADDAVLIDSTGKSIDEVMEEIFSYM